MLQDKKLARIFPDKHYDTIFVKIRPYLEKS